MKYAILSGSALLKLPIVSKNCSNKSCSEFNFVQESHWAYMSISPRSGTRGLKRLPSLKHNNALKQNIRSLWSSVLSKIRIILKSLQNKSY